MNIVCLASEPWKGLWQRHQHLMSRLARRGHKVVFVDPTNLLEALRRPRMLLNRLEQVDDGIVVVRPFFLPLHYKVAAFDSFDAVSTEALVKRALRMLGEESPDVVLLSSPFHSFFLDRFGSSRLVYDCVDASEGLCPTSETREWFVRRERTILTDADAVMAVSKGLLERCSRINPNAHLVSNGVSCSPPTGQVPSDLAELRHPLIGFVGRVGWWVDVGLIRDLAAARPEYSVVLIGPIDSKEGSVQDLRRLSNVHLLGTKEFSTVASYIDAMDACIIPFKVEVLTSMANPVKMFEYAACGQPIVVTPLEELREYSELLYVSDGSTQGFIDQVDAALQERSVELRERRVRMAREHDWEHLTARAEAIISGRVCAGGDASGGRGVGQNDEASLLYRRLLLPSAQSAEPVYRREGGRPG